MVQIFIVLHWLTSFDVSLLCGNPHYAHIYLQNIPSCCGRLALADIDRCTATKSERTIKLYINQHQLDWPLFTGEVKHHNVCKRHGFLDTGFNQTGLLPFSQRYPNGIKQLN